MISKMGKILLILLSRTITILTITIMFSFNQSKKLDSKALKIRNAENLDFTRLSALFVASLPGFEPGAFRLGGEPSIQLRYKDLY